MIWSFDPAEWWVVSRVAGCDSYPGPIGVHPSGDLDGAERRLIRRGVLLGPYLHPDLHDALAALTWPHEWIDACWLTLPDRPGALVAAARGGRGVIAAQGVAGTHLRAVPATALVESMVTDLPVAPPGRAQPVQVTVPAEPAEAPGVLVEVRAGYSRHERSVRAADAVLGADRRRVGQLAANRRGDVGARRSPVARWSDNVDDGRYLITQHGPTITVEPVDDVALGHRLQELLDRTG